MDIEQRAHDLAMFCLNIQFRPDMLLNVKPNENGDTIALEIDKMYIENYKSCLKVLSANQ